MESDLSQLNLLLALTASASTVAMLTVGYARYRKVYGSGSATFTRANAGSNYAKKMSHHVSKGVEILMPVGRGRYPLSLSKNKKKRWEQKFHDWAELGATVKILLTNPTEDSVEYWTKLSKKVGDNFTVSSASSEQYEDCAQESHEIERLVEFHPVLATKYGNPLSMWVEAHHPRNSTVAYNVEYTAPEDLVDTKLDSFNTYKMMLSKYIDQLECAVEKNAA